MMTANSDMERISGNDPISCLTPLTPCNSDPEIEAIEDLKSSPDKSQKARVGPFWSEPDATSFRVRGKKYKKDKKKVPSTPSLFRLIATDIVESDSSILGGICSHPQER
eukprot:14553920-Ditylum_brightwellii.AAC.1